MKFEQRGCPCTNDCQNRSAFCRKTCEPFIAYEKGRMERKVNTHLYSGDITVGKVSRLVGNVRYKHMKRNGRTR